MLTLLCLLFALNVSPEMKIQVVGSDPLPEPVATVADTLNLYGGPGTLEGKFETAEGVADPQGWTTRDDTQPPESCWNIDTYQAANLDPDTPGNHAWWCGAMLPACNPQDIDGGYGNAWDIALSWTAQVADPTKWATVTLDAVLNLDTEPGYDYLTVWVVTSSGRTQLTALDGMAQALALSESFTYQPGDFLGQAADQVELELRFTSDYGWSDEDCLFWGAGAVQIDNILVTVEQPDAEPFTQLETCEEATTYWTPVPPVGVGNFGQLWTGLDDLDLEQDNHSPQWAFLDDGIIVPGTGGSYCVDGYWCYGPDDLVVNIDGGLLGSGNYLRSSVVSPAVALPEQDFDTLVMSLDAYLHNATDAINFDPVCLTWNLEWSDDLEGWVGWDEGFLYISDAGNYTRIVGQVPAEDLPLGTLFARMVVTAYQMIIWDWGYHYPTPAPYFDNVRLQAVLPDSVSAAELPEREFAVSCHPNPFNPAVEISWNLPRAGDLTVAIYDLSGALVRTLRSGPAALGLGSVFWRGDDDAGHQVAAGAYLCRVKAGQQETVRKVMLLK
jgi:hypothetical protein